MPPPQTSIARLLAEIRSRQSEGRFSPYIDLIVFPLYRRIAPMQRLTFAFPLTVLVGRNGTGKSSVLHALSGAPHGNSVASYWFGTAVDPIDAVSGEGVRGRLAPGEKAAFWYEYRRRNVRHQAIKQRVRRANDPDYWEPTVPVDSYGMDVPPPAGKDRHPQIKMPVEYLNLRYHLSAFDRCFNFLSDRTLREFGRSGGWSGMTSPRVSPNRVDFIRHKSSLLNAAFESRTGVKSGGRPVAKPVERLSPDALALVSQIVGKPYTSGELVRHRIYESTGVSVRFQTELGVYTEANAGSGESAVVQIVQLFERASEASLLLLDEPETSLHPGAQRELLEYILRKIRDKRLQVVLSTHSPTIVQLLPAEAIRVLRRDEDGLVRIQEGLSAEEAFYEIGHPFAPNCDVVVEDRLAKAVLERVASARGEGFRAKLRVEFSPGGESRMKQDIAVFMHRAHQPVFVLDGDQLAAHTDPGTLPANLHTAEHLDDVIFHQTNVRVIFQQNGNMPAADRARLREEYLDYYFRKVDYLPFRSPEEGIWNDAVCRNLLDTLVAAGGAAEKASEIAGEPDFKKKFKLLSDAIGGRDMHQSDTHAMFLTRFVNDKGIGFQAVSALLDRVVAAAEAGRA